MYNRKNFKYFFHLLVVYLLLFALVDAEAQNAGKNKYTTELDSLWSNNTYITNLSADGNWMIFKELFHKKENKLFLSNTAGSYKLGLDYSEMIEFSSNSKWVGALTLSKKLSLVNLDNKSINDFYDVISFAFSNDGRFIAIQRKSHEYEKTLEIRDLYNNDTHIIYGVDEYKWNNAKNILAVTREQNGLSGILFYEATTKTEKVIAENDKGYFSNIIWNTLGDKLVFLEAEKEQKKIYLQDIKGGQQVLDSQSVHAVFTDSTIADKEIQISEDGRNVFFYRELIDCKITNDKDLEIWDTAAPWIYPKLTDYDMHERPFLLAMWDTTTGRLLEIADIETPMVKFNPDHKHAIVYNKLTYAPQYKQFEDVDLYVVDFRSGKKSLIAKKIYTDTRYFLFSPSGDYLVYLKNNDCWIYDVKNKRTVNISKDQRYSFFDLERRRTEDAEPYGRPAWSSDEKYVILKDKYDIWLMGTNGKEKKKLTSGREEKISYGIWRDDSKYLISLKYCTGFAYDVHDPLLLTMTGDDLKTGYALWFPQKELVKLVYGQYKVEEALVASDKSKFVFKRSFFNQPPGIYSFNLNNAAPQLVYQSNIDLFDYDLGFFETIKYKVDSTSLKGVLIYPAAFNPKNKYPMISWIYENNSHQVFYFSPPADYSAIGFNILHYVINGYFVFLPDLAYEIGDPGKSALASLESAIEEVLKNPSIDKKRLGLYGHSWGGYETAYIVTQTDTFAAAVAGSGIMDLVSHYHDIAWDFEKDQMWRYEGYQMRMGNSFYKIKDKFFQNSPLYNVENLHTPLLLWVGQEDGNVNWYQSIFMHQAMRRLKKPGKLLLFKHDGHYIYEWSRRRKLTQEIYNWFSHYLQ